MSDSKPLQHPATATTVAFMAIAAVIAMVGAVVLIDSASGLGDVRANATPVVVAPDRAVSPEENNAFIRQGHERAAREGDDTPLPPTF